MCVTQDHLCLGGAWEVGQLINDTCKPGRIVLFRPALGSTFQYGGCPIWQIQAEKQYIWALSAKYVHTQFREPKPWPMKELKCLIGCVVLQDLELHGSSASASRSRSDDRVWANSYFGCIWVLWSHPFLLKVVICFCLINA